MQVAEVWYSYGLTRLDFPSFVPRQAQIMTPGQLQGLISVFCHRTVVIAVAKRVNWVPWSSQIQLTQEGGSL